MLALLFAAMALQTCPAWAAPRPEIKHLTRCEPALLRSSFLNVSGYRPAEGGAITHPNLWKNVILDRGSERWKAASLGPNFNVGSFATFFGKTLLGPLWPLTEGAIYSGLVTGYTEKGHLILRTAAGHEISLNPANVTSTRIGLDGKGNRGKTMRIPDLPWGQSWVGSYEQAVIQIRTAREDHPPKGFEPPLPPRPRPTLVATMVWAGFRFGDEISFIVNTEPMVIVGGTWVDVDAEGNPVLADGAVEKVLDKKVVWASRIVRGAAHDGQFVAFENPHWGIHGASDSYRMRNPKLGFFFGRGPEDAYLLQGPEPESPLELIHASNYIPVERVAWINLLPYDPRKTPPWFPAELAHLEVGGEISVEEQLEDDPRIFVLRNGVFLGFNQGRGSALTIFETGPAPEVIEFPFPNDPRYRMFVEHRGSGEHRYTHVRYFRHF